MSSGVAVGEGVEDLIASVKARKNASAIFCINDQLEEIVVLKSLPPCVDGEEGLRELKKELKKGEPAYAILDFPIKNAEGHSRDNLLFIAWSPDDSPIKLKMLYASSKKYIANLASSAKAIQATDFDELDFVELKKKCQKM